MKEKQLFHAENVSDIKLAHTHTHKVSFNLFRTSTQTDSPQTLHGGEQPEGCAEISGDATARKTHRLATEATLQLFFYVCFNNAADVLNS